MKRDETGQEWHEIGRTFAVWAGVTLAVVLSTLICLFFAIGGLLR